MATHQDEPHLTADERADPRQHVRDDEYEQYGSARMAGLFRATGYCDDKAMAREIRRRLRAMDKERRASQ